MTALPLAHGGTAGLFAELGGIALIVALWGWVWWRSRGIDTDDVEGPGGGGA